MAVRFFIPGADPDITEDFYNWIVRYVHEMTDVVVEPARIFSISYIHEGQQFLVRVGEPEPRTNQLVMAIFRSDSYLICTPYYGVRRGEPISIARSDVRDVVYFEGLDTAREALATAVNLLDAQDGALLQSTIMEAGRLVNALTLDDFPATLSGDFLSLKHKLIWIGISNGSTGAIDEVMARTTVYAIRSLYVDILRLNSELQSHAKGAS